MFYLYPLLEFCSITTNINWTTVCKDSQNDLVINWSQSLSKCSIEQYFINTSNCGSCSAIATHNITCANAPTDGTVCMFTIQSEVHENVTQQFMISTQAECSMVNGESNQK